MSKGLRHGGTLYVYRLYKPISVNSLDEKCLVIRGEGSFPVMPSIDSPNTA